MKKLFVAMILSFILVGLTACKPSTPPAVEQKDVESVEFTMDKTTLTVGEHELKAKALPEGSDQGVKFTLVGIVEGVSITGNKLFITNKAENNLEITINVSSTFDPTIRSSKKFTISNVPVSKETVEITTEEQLRAIELDGNYVLKNDIVLTAPWIPIGVADHEADDGTITPGTPFNGIFDGKGFKISGIEIEGDFNLGFFAQIGALGEVKNTEFVGSVQARGWSGGVAGINVGLITNVISNMEVTVLGGSAGSIVSVNRGVISYSYGIGKLTSDTPVTAGRSTGLVAANEATMTQVYGDIETLKTPNYIAFTPVTNPTYMLSTIDMKTKANFIEFDEEIWYLADGTYPLLKHEGFVPPVIVPELAVRIKNTEVSFDLEKVESVLVDAEVVNGNGSEKLVYAINSVNGIEIDQTGKITFNLLEVDVNSVVTVTVSIQGSEVTATKEFNFTYNPAPTEDIIEISTHEELFDLLSGQVNPETLAKKFVLVNDIVIPEDKVWKGVGLRASSSNTPAEGIPFTGEFDGRGFEISGIKMDKTVRNKGFFNYIGETGIVRNTKFSGHVEGPSWQGGVAYDNKGLITDVIVNLVVYSYAGQAGVIVERNYGTIKNVVVTGKVAADEGKIGLINRQETSGILENVFASSATVGTINVIAGTPEVDPVHIISPELFVSAATYAQFNASIWNIVDGEIPTLKQA